MTSWMRFLVIGTASAPSNLLDTVSSAMHSTTESQSQDDPDVEEETREDEGT